MAPTVLREEGYRFFFFSREEARIHVHVSHADGEAKFWLEPAISLATSTGLNARQLKAIEAIVHQHSESIRHAWLRHFPT
jgi:ribosomal protein L16/L10AE